MTQHETIEIDLWLEDFLEGLFERCGLDLHIGEIATDERTGTLTVQLDGEDKSRAIGRDGQMLDALQTLVVAASAGVRGGGPRERILIDVDHYRTRRDDRLREDAERFAAEVIETGREIDLEPMPPRERRLVHLAVAEIDGISTESVGAGEERRVRLVPAKS